MTFRRITVDDIADEPVEDPGSTDLGSVTDLNVIIDNIDPCEGRNDALRTYIYALRDLQHMHNEYACNADSGVELVDIDVAKRAVNEAFDKLIAAEFTLNRSEVDDRHRVN